MSFFSHRLFQTLRKRAASPACVFPAAAECVCAARAVYTVQSAAETAQPREMSVGKAARPCVPAPGGLRESWLSPGQESGSGTANARAPLLLLGLSLHCPRSPLILCFPIQVLNLSCCRIFTHSGQPSCSVLQMLILH